MLTAPGLVGGAGWAIEAGHDAAGLITARVFWLQEEMRRATDSVSFGGSTGNSPFRFLHKLTAKVLLHFGGRTGAINDNY